MLFRPFALVASFAVVFVSANAGAHALLMNPPPLTSDDNAKSGPCGCYFGGGPEDPNEDATALPCPADYKSTPLVAGSQLQVTWKETVNHNGDFRVAFSTKPINLVTRADLNGGVLYEEPDANNTSGGLISTTITVPNVSCTNCVIQLRQFMAGAAKPYYYSCAAVDIAMPSGSSSSGAASSSSSGGTGGAGGQGGVGGVEEEYDIIAGPAQTTPTQPAGLCSMSAGSDASGAPLWMGILGLFVLAARRRES